MRRTAKYTLVIGFGFSTLALFLFQQFGTGFTTLTAALYLYGFICLLGGLLGYRHAYLKHTQDMKKPRLHHITGLHQLRSLLEPERFRIELEGRTAAAEQIQMNDKLLSVEQPDGTGLSYPREIVEGIAKTEKRPSPFPSYS